MSEASRQRWLFIHNRMEELDAKLGPLPDTPLPDWLDHINAEPTWGPVGSLLEPPPVPLPPAETERRVVHLAEALQKLDQYGETSVYDCEVCGEESAKASMPLRIWHCTACGTWGRVVPPDRRLPETPVHDV